MTMMRELSSGGLVLKQNRILMIQVRNLLGKIVWTFPKGHVENGETPKQSALREIHEETGWICRILKPFAVVRYKFKRGGRKVAKKVSWFLAKPISKTGRKDPEEILKVKWVSLKKAAEISSYPSDIGLVKKLQDFNVLELMTPKVHNRIRS